MTALKKGFTLIELLIVMAILGVLAVVVLLAINPAEQMRRARDTGRISAVQQLGRALAAYYTGSGGTYPAVSATWMDALTTSGELTTVPTQVSTTDTACTGTSQNGYCYNTAVGGTTSYAVVWARLVSQQQGAKCDLDTDGIYFEDAGEEPMTVFSTYDSKGGVVCGTPAAGATLSYK